MRGAEDAYASNQFSAVGMDLNGRGGPEMDPRYQRMVRDVLQQQPKNASGWRVLLP